VKEGGGAGGGRGRAVGGGRGGHARVLGPPGYVQTRFGLKAALGALWHHKLLNGIRESRISESGEAVPRSALGLTTRSRSPVSDGLRAAGSCRPLSAGLQGQGVAHATSCCAKPAIPSAISVHYAFLRRAGAAARDLSRVPEPPPPGRATGGGRPPSTSCCVLLDGHGSTHDQLGYLRTYNFLGPCTLSQLGLTAPSRLRLYSLSFTLKLFNPALHPPLFSARASGWGRGTEAATVWVQTADGASDTAASQCDTYITPTQLWPQRLRFRRQPRPSTRPWWPHGCRGHPQTSVDGSGC
jgi:hypothetical protein